MTSLCFTYFLSFKKTIQVLFQPSIGSPLPVPKGGNQLTIGQQCTGAALPLGEDTHVTITCFKSQARVTSVCHTCPL